MHDDRRFESMLNKKREIKEPLTVESSTDMVKYFSDAELGFLEVCAEKYCLGSDFDGYIIIGNMTPDKNNPKNSYYILHQNSRFKQEKKFKYKIDYVTEYSDDGDDLNAECYTVCKAMNLHECIRSICSHWIPLSRQ